VNKTDRARLKNQARAIEKMSDYDNKKMSDCDKTFFDRAPARERAFVPDKK